MNKLTVPICVYVYAYACMYSHHTRDVCAFSFHTEYISKVLLYLNECFSVPKLWCYAIVIY